MSLLRFPDPYDFELSTGRFRAFGTDLANRLDGEVLVRAVAGREVRIQARPGGVDVEPLDDVTRPVVEHLLGAPFDLGSFYTWAASDPLLAPVVERLRGFRHEGLCPVCGDRCKRRSLPDERPIVFVGDGWSDRCASLAVDRVFARTGLAAYLDEQGVLYERYDTFHDVTAALS